VTTTAISTTAPYRSVVSVRSPGAPHDEPGASTFSAPADSPAEDAADDKTIRGPSEVSSNAQRAVAWRKFAEPPTGTPESIERSSLIAVFSVIFSFITALRAPDMPRIFEHVF
jgi:hypothetical protein